MATTLGFAGERRMRKKPSKENNEEDKKNSQFPSPLAVLLPMRYTFRSIPTSATPEEGLQIFSIKVAQLKEEEGLRWPLHVYGLIAVRDSIDPRRNLLFCHTRDGCQTITEEDPFLLLTGPSRAIVIIDPVSFEVQLKAKGESGSEDKVLVYDVLNSQHAVSHMGHPPPVNTSYLWGKCCNLGFAFAVLSRTVEATICVEVVEGSWPENIPGRITTCTASIPKTKILLLDSGSARVPVNDSGIIKLSRQVVSVELCGQLKVQVQAVYAGEHIKKNVYFTPKKATISWSLFSESESESDSDPADLL
ncbi:hypothetical protein C2845_PM08G30810 [Panicum miliaceum]|uniref:DUF6598 domain-containing protein n=1 Tax=Panicum miliaceum TaxID=4540 RepID=A0A3L6QX90_PANMI|nr:hypothetical protein C2845_PM08G30810 [Panicum miliaceum]